MGFRQIWAPTCALLLLHCSSGNPELRQSPGIDQGGTAGSGATTGDAGTSPLPAGGDPGIDVGGSQGTSGTGGTKGPVDTMGCGDGVQSAALGEACDDGNNVSGDGCSGDCAAVETSFVCPKPGQPCISTVVCGDGKLGGAETCDDGNTDAKDGCDAHCELEPGWSCAEGEPCQAAKCGDGIVAGVEQCEDDDPTPTGGDGCSADCALEPGFVCETAGQACRKAVCGDGIAEGGEPCDDKNQVVGDGCSPTCEAEPICDKPSDADGCSSSCGDGLILAGDAEECDDGNKRDGDGCSSKCKIEAGYECAKQTGALPASLTIPFVFRDFVAFPSATTTQKRHPDFQARCTQFQSGMVNPLLDADGKPVNSGTCNLAATCTLKQGPQTPDLNNACSDANRNETCPGNNYGTCSQLHASFPIAGHPADDPFKFWYRDTSDVNKTLVSPTTLALTGNAYVFDSKALYPFDGGGWVKSGDEVAASNGHNYGFTSEVRRWFEFNGGELLTFTGDDDVWVFINGKLALDIGGVHEVEKRTIRLNADGSVDCKVGEPGVFDSLTNCDVPTRSLGLITGKVYEIALFHAERHTIDSNFRLALTGFVEVKSKCSPVCGDGTQTPGEACDNGKDNDDDAYGGCTKSCKRGPRCGDGKVQADHEDCDDGTNLTPYSAKGKGCAPGCKLPATCGDGNVDSLFGETCDDGTNKGGYGGCEADCTLAPRCGDDVVDEPEEECDDGNAVSGDGCSAKCTVEAPK